MKNLKNNKEYKFEKYVFIFAFLLIVLSVYYFYPKKYTVCDVFGQPEDRCKTFLCQGFVISGIPNSSCYGKTIDEKGTPLYAPNSN